MSTQVKANPGQTQLEKKQAAKKKKKTNLTQPLQLIGGLKSADPAAVAVAVNMIAAPCKYRTEHRTLNQPAKSSISATPPAKQTIIKNNWN